MNTSIGSTPENTGYKTYVVQNLLSNEIFCKLNYLKHCLSSSYGPCGRTKLITNLDDEDIKCGSSSSLLLDCELLNVDDSIIAVIVSCAKEHLKAHRDFGLYCLLFSITLVETSMSVDMAPSLLSHCYRHFLGVISSHLQDRNSCSLIRKVDIAKADVLLALVRSILMSKPCLAFCKSDLYLLSQLLLKSFIYCMPNNMMVEKIMLPIVLFVKSNSVEDSTVFKGLLLELSHQSQDCINNLLVSSNVTKKSWVVVLNMSLTFDDFLKVHQEKCKDISQSVIDAIMKQFKIFAKKLKENRIAVVFNQKVMCDELKYALKLESIITIDRIGLCQMEALKHITKAKEISSIMEDISKCRNYIDELSIVTIKTKSFVGIKRNDVNISSIVVCYGNPYILNDLKHVCWATMSALDRTLKSQLVIAGGSVMEEYLIYYLKNSFEIPKASGFFACSLVQWQVSVKAFCTSLNFMKNLCSNKIRGEDVYDCYESKINAFIVAIETACIALEIKYQIHDYK